VILREEHRLRVFENRVLRRIFASKRDEVTGGWIKLHNEELHNLYSSPSISRKMKSEDEMGRACCTNGEKRNVYWILVGKPDRKRPLGRPRHRCVNNIKMDLRENTRSADICHTYCVLSFLPLQWHPAC
jgi:hypothetical protein